MAEGFHFSGLRILSQIFADNIILLASSDGGFQLTLECFAAKCEAAGMRICLRPSSSAGKCGVPHSGSGMSCCC